MKPKVDREAQRRLVHWEHVRNYATVAHQHLANKKNANVDEVELVRWVEDALKDIRKSLARVSTRL